VEDPVVVGVGDAHHVADDLQRQWACQFGHQVGAPVRMVRHHLLDEPARTVAHRVLDHRQDARRERTADDVAQPGVPRIVHRDHRAEVLGEFGRLIADRDALGGAEDLRVAAGVEHVVVPGDGPVSTTTFEPVLNELRLQ
jgi:hypothetical protein